MAGLLGLNAGLSTYHLNQTKGSASMLDRMIRDDLRLGKNEHALERAREVEALIKLQALDQSESLMLQLLAARLVETCCEALNDAYARKVDLFVGHIFAVGQLPEGAVRDECYRFRVRMWLNRGNPPEARFYVNRIDRHHLVLSPVAGRQNSEKLDNSEEKIRAETWLLLAEVALAEGDYEEAARCLSTAKSKWDDPRLTFNDRVFFELLDALVKIGLGDQAGVAALAYLYSEHQLSTSSLDLAMKARIAAAAGYVERVEAISTLELERWRALGPPARESVEAYLGCGRLPELEGSAAELPEPEAFLPLIDSLGSSSPAATEAVIIAPLLDASAQVLFAGLASYFSLECKRLDSVTQMFDNDRTTGPLLVDWSYCEEAIISDAVASRAVPELALLVKSATIYFNYGAYVDAVFNTADEELLMMKPGDVIFEVYRIAMAQLPGTCARQLADGLSALRAAERINVRPNDFNLDLVRRFDETNRALLGGELPQPDEEEDPFANWNSFGPADSSTASTASISTHISAPEVAARALEPFEGIFNADSLQKVCAAIIESISGLGQDHSRVEILVADEGAMICSAGSESRDQLVWSTLDAGPLQLRLGVVSTESEHQHLVRLIMDAGVHRIRLMPGLAYRGRILETPDFIAADIVTHRLLETVQVFARQDKNFLITGERGVGKEHIAKFLHQWSSRAEHPFFPVDGAGINNPDQLIAELFGAKRGSYTGSDRDRRGVVEQAQGGDLFIDEIDEGISVQAVLKRFAQFKTYKKLGSSEQSEADVRLIIATNQIGDGGALIKEDLRDRFWEIRVPPLRERRGDIRPLAEFFAQQLKMVLPDSVLAWLEKLDWPGNIRQLQNCVHRACSLAQVPSNLTLTLVEECVERTGGKRLPVMSSSDPGFIPLRPGETLAERLLEHEKQYILAALEAAEGNKTKLAALLGYQRTALYKKLRSLGIT